MSIALEQSNSGCISKLQTSWREFLSWTRNEHSVHPLAPIAPEYSEFVIINSKLRIRCIHINPDALRKSKILEFNNDQGKSKRNSLSEEYWFTKWNKPLRIGNCNCSFRKSLRLSLISSQDVIDIIDKPPLPRTKMPEPLKITNVETFVERLIQDTLFEALQEFYMSETLKNKTLGVVNLAFTFNEDIVEPRKHKFNGQVGYNKRVLKNVDEIKAHPTKEDVTVELRKDSENLNIQIGSTSEFDRCKHLRSKEKKPLVILFHGIGTSSDIWWMVIKTLVSKGYEIVAPDMLGHGYSSAPAPPKSYSFHNLLLHALAIFDNYIGLDENRKCILIGHSYGCSFATAVYHHRMGLISQMILISGGGPTPLAPPVKHDELIHTECFQALIQPLIFCGVNRSLFYSSRGKFFDVSEESVGIPNHVLNSVKMGQNWPEGDAAFHRRIFVPTLLVHGLQDKQVTLVQECEMERTIPRSFLELIPNAGHMPMLETPEHLTHMILCFLDCWS